MLYKHVRVLFISAKWHGSEIYIFFVPHKNPIRSLISCVKYFTAIFFYAPNCNDHNNWIYPWPMVNEICRWLRGFNTLNSTKQFTKHVDFGDFSTGWRECSLLRRYVALRSWVATLQPSFVDSVIRWLEISLVQWDFTLFTPLNTTRLTNLLA